MPSPTTNHRENSPRVAPSACIWKTCSAQGGHMQHQGRAKNFGEWSLGFCVVAWWRGGVVAWWRGGVVAWWRGGVVAWWRGGVMAWWRGGVVAWWRGGVVAWWGGGVVEW